MIPQQKTLQRQQNSDSQTGNSNSEDNNHSLSNHSNSDVLGQFSIIESGNQARLSMEGGNQARLSLSLAAPGELLPRIAEEKDSPTNAASTMVGDERSIEQKIAESEKQMLVVDQKGVPILKDQKNEKQVTQTTCLDDTFDSSLNSSLDTTQTSETIMDLSSDFNTTGPTSDISSFLDISDSSNTSMNDDSFVERFIHKNMHASPSRKRHEENKDIKMIEPNFKVTEIKKLSMETKLPNLLEMCLKDSEENSKKCQQPFQIISEMNKNQELPRSPSLVEQITSKLESLNLKSVQETSQYCRSPKGLSDSQQRFFKGKMDGQECTSNKHIISPTKNHSPSTKTDAIEKVAATVIDIVKSNQVPPKTYAAVIKSDAMSKSAITPKEAVDVKNQSSSNSKSMEKLDQKSSTLQTGPSVTQSRSRSKEDFLNKVDVKASSESSSKTDSSISKPKVVSSDDKSTNDNRDKTISPLKNADKCKLSEAGSKMKVSQSFTKDTSSNETIKQLDSLSKSQNITTADSSSSISKSLIDSSRSLNKSDLSCVKISDSKMSDSSSGGNSDSTNVKTTNSSSSGRSDSADVKKTDSSSSGGKSDSKKSDCVKMSDSSGSNADESLFKKPDSTSLKKSYSASVKKSDSLNAQKSESPSSQKTDLSNVQKFDSSSAQKSDVSNKQKLVSANAQKTDLSSLQKSESSNAQKPEASNAQKLEATHLQKSSLSLTGGQQDNNSSVLTFAEKMVKKKK